ncbi:MAG TPA: YkvA family protein [Allocoleopsis sp.]
MASGQYSDNSFWEKLRDFAVQAGREVVEKALTLFYAAQRPETPLWAKTVIYSALAYFILPADAIPDFAPFAGYADDMGTLVAALGTVAMCITPEVQQAARKSVDDWFGEAGTQQANPAQNDSPIREIQID